MFRRNTAQGPPCIIMKPRLEWKVGFFVLIGLVLLAVLLIQFSKGMTLFRPTYNILLRSANVSGLKERASVLMAGVQVGTVASISLDPDGKTVTIDLRIYKRFRIFNDARFLIETSGFLGDQYVAIQPTKNEGSLFNNGDIAQAEPPFDIQEVARSASGFVERIDETAKKLNDAVVDVRKYLLNEETLTNLSIAAGNLRLAAESAMVAAGNINQFLETNGPALSQSGTNLLQFSEQMNQLAVNLNGLVTTNGPAIDQAVKNIESSSELLKNVLDDVRAGRGFAGEVLKDPQLAAYMSEIAQNLSVTTSNLNRLGLWGILWKHEPPKSEPPKKRAAAPEIAH
jgi:phospholipid/cholesterol/gamma-HCH transport system substrate-binding protein